MQNQKNPKNQKNGLTVVVGKWKVESREGGAWRTHILTQCCRVYDLDDGLATHVSEVFEQAVALRNLLPEFSLMK